MQWYRDDWFTQSREKEEEAAGHRVRRPMQSSTHIQSISDLLHLHRATSFLKEAFLSGEVYFIEKVSSFQVKDMYFEHLSITTT